MVLIYIHHSQVFLVLCVSLCCAVVDSLFSVLQRWFVSSVLLAAADRIHLVMCVYMCIIATFCTASFHDGSLIMLPMRN